MSVGVRVRIVALIQPVLLSRSLEKKRKTANGPWSPSMDKGTMVALRRCSTFRSWAACVTRERTLVSAARPSCCQFKPCCCCCCLLCCVVLRRRGQINRTFLNQNCANILQVECRKSLKSKRRKNPPQRTPIGGRGPRLLWLLAAEGSESTRALAPLSPLSAPYVLLNLLRCHCIAVTRRVPRHRLPHAWRGWPAVGLTVSVGRITAGRGRPSTARAQGITR